MRSVGEVAAAGAYRGPPWFEDRAQLHDVVTERVEGRPHLLVGRHLDRLAGVAPGGGEAVAVDQPTGPEPLRRGVELGLDPRPVRR